MNHERRKLSEADRVDIVFIISKIFQLSPFECTFLSKMEKLVSAHSHSIN